MAGHVTTPARRLQPPTWRDRRLLVGVVLILGSIGLGAFVVQRAGSTQPMYVARHAMTPGQSLTLADLSVVHVALGDTGQHYLTARRDLPSGAVVIRSVQGGELVPSSSIGDQESVTMRPVAVPVSAGSAGGLHPGALVDVWVADKTAQPGSEAFDAPRVVVSAAEVVSVSGAGGVLSDSREATVRLLLANDLVAPVLSAVDNSARIDLVPVPGSESPARS